MKTKLKKKPMRFYRTTSNELRYLFKYSDGSEVFNILYFSQIQPQTIHKLFNNSSCKILLREKLRERKDEN
jgi:hypothetical protein